MQTEAHLQFWNGPPLTCQHALIHHTVPVEKDGIAWHHHPIGWNNDDITRNEFGRHGLLYVWDPNEEKGRREQKV